MTYSLHLLKKPGEYQELLKFLNDYSNDISYRHMRQRRSYEILMESAQSVKDDLKSLTADIRSLEAVFKRLSPGMVHSDMEDRLVKLRYKKHLLQEKSSRFNALAVLQKEFELQCLERAQAEAVEFIKMIGMRMEEVGRTEKMNSSSDSNS